MGRRWTGSLAGVGLLLGLAAMAAVVSGQTAGDKAPTAAETFTNVQVLKDLPADQLLVVMQEYNTSLGVTCDYCHDLQDFTKDTNPHKKVAREMIALTRKLNATEPSLKKKMTCYSCHHGAAHPARTEEEAKAAAKKAAEAKQPAPEAK